MKQTGEKTKTDKQVDTKSLNAWIRAFALKQKCEK